MKGPCRNTSLDLSNGVPLNLGCSFGTFTSPAAFLSLVHTYLSTFSFRFKLLLPDGGDSESIIRTKAYEHGVLALPGTVFLPSGKKTAYVRAAFSLLSEEDVEEALRRLRQVLIQETRGSDLPESA